MIIKAINIALGVVVALSVCCAAVLFVIVTWHLLVAGGAAAYNLMHS